MTAWTEWEIVRHQVAIGGCVLGAKDRPIVAAQVMFTEMPEEYRKYLRIAARTAGANWDELDERPDRTRSRADGIYYFLDLPPGRYTVQAIDKRTGAQSFKTVSVLRDRSGKVKFVKTNLELVGT